MGNLKRRIKKLEEKLKPEEVHPDKRPWIGALSKEELDQRLEEYYRDFPGAPKPNIIIVSRITQNSEGEFIDEFPKKHKKYDVDTDASSEDT